MQRREGGLADSKNLVGELRDLEPIQAAPPHSCMRLRYCRRERRPRPARSALVHRDRGGQDERGQRPRLQQRPHRSSESRSMKLSNVVIVYEAEDSARRRLISFGYLPEIAAEIAVYLGQATDLPDFFDEISGAARRAGIEVEFVEIERLLARLPDFRERRERTLLWSITDGVRFYRGSAVSALSRLSGVARFGSPAI